MEVKKESQACGTAAASAKRKGSRVVTSRAPPTAAVGSSNGSVPDSSEGVDDASKQGLTPSRKRPRVAEDYLIHPPDGSVSVLF